jgi:hypothetical protein
MNKMCFIVTITQKYRGITGYGITVGCSKALAF